MKVTDTAHTALDTYEGVAFQALEIIGKSGAKKAWRMAQGEDQDGSILAEVLIDSARSVANGFVTSSIGTGVGVAAETAGLGGITRINAHLAIAAAIVQGSKSLCAYLDNRIDAGQMLDEINQTAVHGTASFYYGTVGQTVIPIPVAGALIGSIVGYFVGTILYQSSLLSLGEPVSVRQAQKRRQCVEEICHHAIPLIQLHREELQRVIKENCIGQVALFDAAFQTMDAACAESDQHAYICQLETICSALHAALPFKTFREFDLFMHDSTKVFEL
ncbi:MAG: hypothetical protein ACOYL3_22130 [Desulfuromonadaceae bacterium]